MEEVKICIICGKNLGESTCINCGSLVCYSCYSKKRGLCTNCIIGKH